MRPNTNIAIVGGGGHVGLPLGIMLADRGMRVTLLDLDQQRVDQINSGQMPFMEEGAGVLLRRHIGKSLVATLDSNCLQHADVVITVVGTPVDRHLSPNLNEVYRIMDDVICRMKEDAMLILRSTVYPGMTKLIYDRIHALGRKIQLAFCPERIAEGHAIEELATLPQLISAFDPGAMKVARDLFLTLAPSVIELQPIEAELAKLFSNSWRYLNFAISNQFYTLAQSYDLDFYRIHDAVTRDYPRMKSFARPGFAAGPCLLKDTLHLGAFAKNNFFLGHAAMLINEGLPNFIVEQLRRSGLSSRRISILGMAFKADSDDYRESLSYKLRNLLKLEASEVLCTDPYVPDPTLVPLDQAIQNSDVVILGAPHTVYRDLEISPDKVVMDIWNFWKTESARKVESLYATPAPVA
ncbi:MAG TPA: nucleotide sugar dehydrogenase [Candidatus Acidoferrales bacterium]|nr:nucleotide sugar dehydrogenase [Candidatus Acidoferrales bacterium]